jgi:hypothetical protein
MNFVNNLDLSAKGLWFVLLISIVLFLFAIFIPKKQLGWREFYITFSTVGLTAWLADSIIAKMFDLIDLGNPNITGIGEFFSYTLIPSSLSILFLNQLKTNNKWLLTIMFTLISTLIEWAFLKVGYIHPNGWTWYFSIPAYIILFSYFLPLHMKIIRCRDK